MKLADLHLHTNFSDGTFTPEELVKEAINAGLSTIAITDHDTINGILPAKIAAGDILEVIPAVEMSAELDSKEFHILGYFVDLDSAVLNVQLKKMYEVRIERVYSILEKLRGLNINMEPEEVFGIAGQGTVSRLHIARALLAKGAVSNIYEAFARFIGNDGPAYVGKFSVSPLETISLIKEAGGIPVLAHPYTYNRDELIPSLIKSGLRGIEAYYPEYPKSVVQFYLKVAEKYGLLVTGGSDCHGIGKPDIKVGCVKMPYELVERLKQEKYG